MEGFSAYLKSTYLTYKESTQKSLQWVAGKAKDLGYPLNNGVIDTKGIVECARWVADHGPPKTIPYSFAVALNYAISIRTIHGGLRAGIDLRSDARHRHFIDVLKKVRETLSSLMDSKVAKAAGIQADPAITLSNQFAELEVEEPSEEFLRAPDISLPPIKNRFEIERDPLEEALIAIDLILEDYKSFRTVIRECWQEYRKGSKDLIEISIMTNTAMDLTRRFEADAKGLFDECGGLSTVLKQYYKNRSTDASLASGASENESSSNAHEMAEPFLDSTFSGLEEFLNSIKDGSLPVIDAAKEGPAPLPNLPVSRSSDPTVVEAKRTADETFLKAMLLDFYVVAIKMKRILPEDELTRGLRTIFETKKPSLWVLFALQVYLDINSIFGEDVAQGYWDAYRFAMSIHRSIAANFKHFQSIQCDPWPHSKDLALQQIQTDIEKVFDDDLVKQRKNQLGLSDAIPGTFNTHWKSHPVRCGLIGYNIRMRYQELSVLFEAKWQTIYYTYILYYSLRVQNLLRTPWEDMEALLELQPQLDLKRRASTLEDVLLRVGTDLGVSASVAGADRRLGSRISIVDERTQHIRLQEFNTIALMFKKRFCDDDGRIDFTEEDLVKILSKAVPVPSKAKKTSKTNNKSKKSKGGKKAKKVEAPKDERPTIPQLLQTLREKLVAEKSSSDFDYLDFSRLCWLLLKRLRPKVEHELIMHLGMDYLEHDHLPFICLAILNRGYEAKTERDPSGRALFIRARDCYTAFTNEKGSNIVNPAESRGFDPANDHVAVFNSRFDKGGEYVKMMKEPGDKQDKHHAWARQVTDRKMDELVGAFGSSGPELKRILQERLFGDAR